MLAPKQVSQQNYLKSQAVSTTFFKCPAVGKYELVCWDIITEVKSSTWNECVYKTYSKSSANVILKLNLCIMSQTSKLYTIIIVTVISKTDFDCLLYSTEI